MQAKNEKVSITVSFFERFPGAQEHIFRIREIVNIQVMKEFDIVRHYVQNDGPSQEIPNNVSDSDKVNDVESSPLNYRTIKSLI